MEEKYIPSSLHDQNKSNIITNNLKQKYQSFPNNVLLGNICKKDPLFYKLLAYQFQLPVEKRTSADKAAMCKILTQENILRQLNEDLKENMIQQLTKILKIDRYLGKQIIYEGNQNDENYYIVLSGKIILVQKNDIIKLDKKIKKNKIFVDKIQYNKHQYRQQYQLLQKQTSNLKSSLAYASQQSFLLKINYSSYHKIIHIQSHPIIDYPIFRINHFFSYFSKSQLKQILENSVFAEFFNGNTIYKIGQPANNFYFLKQGQIILKLQQKDHQKQNYNINNHINKTHLLISTLTNHTIFGQSQCLKSIKRKHTAQVISSRALVYIFDLARIQKILKLKNQNIQIFKQKLYHESVSRKQRWRQKKIQQLKSFQNSVNKKQGDHYKSLHCSNSSFNLVVKKYIHNSEQIQDKLKNNSFIINLQNKYTIHKPISFANPLFIRKDFPQLQTYLRRYQNQEKRIKTKLSLPKL